MFFFLHCFYDLFSRENFWELSSIIFSVYSISLLLSFLQYSCTQCTKNCKISTLVRREIRKKFNNPHFWAMQLNFTFLSTLCVCLCVCILATPLHNSAVLHDAPINMATQNLITTSSRIYYTITARNMHGMVNRVNNMEY